MKRFILLLNCCCSLFSFACDAQSTSFFNLGHSHNDYHQPRPLYTAYRAGMASIEADVFLKNGHLYVAHDSTEIRIGQTLKKLYLEPLAMLYAQNGNHAFPDSGKRLQLVIDIKEAHPVVIAQLVKELQAFDDIFNMVANPQAIRIVISGDLPLPATFRKYPSYLAFDGRPDIVYSDAELTRIAMISADFKKYTKWKGRGALPAAEIMRLKLLVDQAHQKQKPFRFWGIPDLPASWKVMETLGVDWINTDVPQQLECYFHSK
jgi:alkaline phosphatase